MNAYLIEQYTNMGNAYTTNRLLEEAQKSGVMMRVVGVEDTMLQNGKVYHKNRELEQVDFVINRYKYGVAKDGINALAKHQYNPLDKLNRYINKANELIDIADVDVHIPNYVLAKSAFSFETIADILGTPFVAKGLCSSQGREVYLIENENQYRQICKHHAGEELLFEEFIAESFGCDCRFFMIHGEVKACMKRQSAEGFRANFALGATVSKLEIDTRIREIGAAIYKRTGLELLGVDLLFGKEDYVFCEINVTPGIEGMERATGVNVAGEILDFIK